jgi:hypothetical protein
MESGNRRRTKNTATDLGRRGFSVDAPPTHHSIMVVDIESFSTRVETVQASLRDAMYRAVRGAFADAGLDWDAVLSEDRGDGILMLVPASVSPVVLIAEVVRVLNDRLAERARAVSPEFALRLRVSLHQGLASPDEHGWSGDAVVHAFRLIDGQPLRETLRTARRAHLAFVVSDEVHRSVVRHHHRSIDAASYGAARFDIKGSSAAVGWIHVPGFSSPPGLQDVAAEKPSEPEPVQADRSRREEPVRTVFSIGTVQGDAVAGDKITIRHEGPA